MSHSHRFLSLCLAVAGLALLLSIFPSPATAQAKHQVVATTGMVGDVVRSVAGDRADVEILIGPGVDPHLYAPSRRDVAALLKADAVFYNGLLLEGRMSDILVRVSRQRPVYAVTELIDQSWLLSESDGAPDPHVWMDAEGWMRAADAVAESLVEFDAANAAAYRANAEAYKAELRKLDEYAQKSIASIPERQRVLITAHDAFQYFGRAYGIEVHGIQGLSTESEAGLQDINRLVELVVERQVPAIFVESSISDRNVRALKEGAASRGRDVAVGGTLFSDAMGPAGSYTGTYIGMIDHNVTTITRALGGNAPAGGMQGRLAN